MTKPTELDIAIMSAISRYNRRHPELTPDHIRESFERLKVRLATEEAAKAKDKLPREPAYGTSKP